MKNSRDLRAKIRLFAREVKMGLKGLGALFREQLNISISCVLIVFCTPTL